MKIDRKLNLVLKVETDDGRDLHVHSTPIAYAIFEKYFYVMSQSFNAIFTGGIGTVTGPRVAAMLLRRCAEQSGEWAGPEGVEAGLLGEIRRLTNVAVPNASGGWNMTPLDVVLSQEILDDEDVSEVMNAIVFFTLVSSINRAKDRAGMLDTVRQFWGGLLTPLGVTEYISSLATSKTDANTGATGPGSFTVT